MDDSSSDEFPPDPFTQGERIHGCIVVHFIILFYCFAFIGFICRDYFLPSVFCICRSLNISADIAAATFMASATSVPEMAVNVIGTFLTESDLGIGTIVGSSICNTLAVIGFASLAVRKTIELEKWSIIRDSTVHIFVLGILSWILADNKVTWYEATVLVCLYFIYFFFMLTYKYAIRFWKTRIRGNHYNISKLNLAANQVDDGGNANNELHHSETVAPSQDIKLAKTYETFQNTAPNDQLDDDDAAACSDGMANNIAKILIAPVTWILSMTIPNCNTKPRVFPVTFIVCAVWIGIISYVASWMVTTIGITFGVSDVVMGMTFLAVGSSIPELSSAIVNARNDVGSMSICNTLGANTLDILLSLGMPWFVKTVIISGLIGGKPGIVRTSSMGLEFNCVGLAGSVIYLNAVAFLNSYKMNRLFGFFCLLGYFTVITVFILADYKIIPTDFRTIFPL